MDNTKQKFLIELLISSPDTYAMCQGIIKATYFDPEYQRVIMFIVKYFNEYSTTPNTKQIEAETGMLLRMHEITTDQVSYCADEIEEFCQKRAMEEAVIIAVELITNDAKHAEAAAVMLAASQISLSKNLGLSYFSSVEERLQRNLIGTQTSPTGWSKLDDALFGGISRKELLLVSANSGGGKSITLANLALNFVNRGLDVLYISLELSEDVIGSRFDTMYTGISRKVWKEHVDEITKTVTKAGKNIGALDIVQMPTETSANDIRAYLKEFELRNKRIPDMIVLDYLDNMGANEAISADNVFQKDKLCSEQLRQIGIDYDMFIATASQLNRSAIEAPSHNHSQIAGGLSKIQVADTYFSIIMTDEMRAMEKIIFILQKTRNSDGVGDHIHLKWDNKYLRIVDDDTAASDQLIFKKKKPSDAPPGVDLSDADHMFNTLPNV